MKKVIVVLLGLVLFLGWKSYGEKIYSITSNPTTPIKNFLKGAIENDVDLFLKGSSKEDLDIYCRKYGLTEEQMRMEAKEGLQMIHDNFKKHNIKMDDFEISIPEDFKSRDYVWVKVKYVGPIEADFGSGDFPVYKASDGKWYMPQDGSKHDLSTRRVGLNNKKYICI